MICLTKAKNYQCEMAFVFILGFMQKIAMCWCRVCLYNFLSFFLVWSILNTSHILSNCVRNMLYDIYIYSMFLTHFDKTNLRINSSINLQLVLIKYDTSNTFHLKLLCISNTYIHWPLSVALKLISPFYKVINIPPALA